MLSKAWLSFRMFGLALEMILVGVHINEVEEILELLLLTRLCKGCDWHFEWDQVFLSFV